MGDEDVASYLGGRIDDLVMRELTCHAPKSSDDDTLTMDKMKRIHRCRVRYFAGYGMPGEDLYVLKATPREVLGVLWQDGMREPTVEGPIAPPLSRGGILNLDYNVT